ncbi:MAG TPA: serine/threonine-protein kinase [Candidatus Acidoferrum sp.]|nr:serine/threonine-protein kinase [Candidatus Acidoferrum sp.]
MPPKDADPVSSDDGRTTESAQAPATHAMVIGHYSLLQKIGEGGMGEVWLAEQKEPVRRRVAVKLIKAGMNTREVIGRFESERQALALMEHPAIAKVFDAGSTPEGAPYFVMEYVAGMPITEYCDNHRLAIKERLELFTHVCEGVRHAHQKAVIHRDLKPSNILVAELDGKAMPKIIDFGVAKALSQKLTEHTMFTRAGALIGTPEYMSPEQAFSSGEDVDTRSDIYSLGIIFYELLAGLPPIELRRLAFDEFLKRLREEDPPRPSTKIRTQDNATSSALAHKRQTEPQGLVKQIGGDLDAIALKALEKDRARRYSSVSDFAADIERYLRNEAVVAVPPSAAYRARKYARRHRWGMAMASAFVAVLAAASIISIRQGIRANREAAIAQAVSDFLRNDVLAQASAETQAGPSTKPDPDLKVRTALDRAAERIGGKFDKQPDVEAAIRDTIGRTYTDLGLYPEARTQLERALELHRRVSGAEDPKTLATSSSLGYVALAQGRHADAEKILTETLETQRRKLGAENPETLASMTNLESVYEQEAKFPEAEILAKQALEIQNRTAGQSHPLTLKSMNNLALVYYDEGKYAEAEKLNTDIVALRRRILGPEHPETTMSMSNLALIYSAEQKYSDAESLDRQVVEIMRRVLGPEHRSTLLSMNNLAVVYRFEGKFAEATESDNQILEVRRRVLGPEHPDTLQSMHNVASDNYMAGRYAQADALLNETVETRRRVLGPEHAKTLLSMNMLADVYTVEGKYAQAESLLTEVLNIRRRVVGPDHPGTIDALSDLEFLSEKKGDYPAAEKFAADVLAAHRRRLGSDNVTTASAALDLARVLVMEKNFVAGEPLAREAFALYQKQQPDDINRFLAESALGASLAGQKKYAESEPLLIEGHQGTEARKDRVGIPFRYQVDLARDWLVQMYVGWGKPEKAAEWKKK